MRGQIGILRRCQRCDELLSIEQFEPLGRLCMACSKSPGRVKAVERIAYARAIVLTPKGRAAIREFAAA
jgi:hypothetical protein